MDIVGTTFFKVLRQEKRLLKINVVAFATSAVITFTGTYIFHSVEFTLIGVMLILGIRSTYSELKITNILGVETTRLGFMALALSAAFVAIAQVVSPLVASLAFSVIYLAYLLVNKKYLQSILQAASKLKQAA